MNGPVITTERLILRPHVPDDLIHSHPVYCDAEVRRFIGGDAPREEDSWNRLLRYAGHWLHFGFGMFAIFEKDGAAFVGDTGFADFHRGLGEDFDPFPEAAWILAPNMHGKGYALEAAQAAHAWLGSNRPAERTVCIIDPENTPSLRLAEKLGYSPYGTADYKGASPIKLERKS
ncbi:MAG: GNAT family protein [Blastomonas sp.]